MLSTKTKSNTVFSFLNELEKGDEAKKEEPKKDGEAGAGGLAQDLSKPETKLKAEGAVASPQFKNQSYFPSISAGPKQLSIEVNGEFFRINPTKVKKDDSADGKKDDAKKDEAVGAKDGATGGKSHPELGFVVHARSNYIFYTTDDKDTNVVGSILVKDIQENGETDPITGKNTCFDVYDSDVVKYHICLDSEDNSNKFICSFQKLLNQPLMSVCEEAKKDDKDKPKKPDQEPETIVNPLVLIPLQSRECNEGWNYKNRGADWECTCKEGKHQSPIDLPAKSDATDTNVKPIFQYRITPKIADKSTLDGDVVAGDVLRLKYDKFALRLRAESIGKVVTLDGAVFIGEEVVIHTPAQHKIAGVKFDVEVEILHTGRSKGDLDKNLNLSVLFKMKPGVENKFFDRIGYLDLPNPVDKVRELEEDFFVPTLFYSKDDPNTPLLEPFSFFYYEGSLTAPPCTERVFYYVASDPLPVSSMTIELLKDALRIPDSVSAKGDLVIDDSSPTNARDVQPLGDREVFHYDCVALGQCSKTVKEKTAPLGHYEKVNKVMKEMVFIEGNRPSGIPGALLISKAEAEGSERVQS